MVTQSEYWNGKAGKKWASLANNQDTLLGKLGEATMDAAGVSNGQSVLDIGCGSGGSTFEISRRIGSDGTVWGVDISKPMLDIAIARLTSHDIGNVRFSEADVTTFDFTNHSFDIAFSRFGVMFFEDSVAAFRNINKSLLPGSPLSFVCWQSPIQNPWQSLFVQEVKKFIDLPAPPPRSPGPFAFMESNYVNSILENSNFESIEIEGHEAEVNMFSGRSLADSVKDYMAINPVVSEMLKDSSNQVKQEIIKSTMEVFSPYYSDKGLIFPGAAWLVTAKKEANA